MNKLLLTVFLVIIGVSIGSLAREEVFLTNFMKQSLLFDYFMKGGDEK